MPDALMSGGLITNHTGESGASYRFEWNERYAMHIYLGRELTPEEFNKVVTDMFAAKDYWFRIVPQAVEANTNQEANEPQSISQLPQEEAPKRRGRPPKEMPAIASDEPDFS